MPVLHDRILEDLVTRCRPAQPGRPWLLFIHGLGESSLGFLPVLRSPRLCDSGVGILAPDLPGYGRTPAEDDDPASLEQLAGSLRAWLPASVSALSSEAAVAPAEVVVVGHSMGGVLGQMLCESLEARGPGSKRYVLAGFVNIEGNLSRGDCNYSGLAEPFSREEYLRHGHQAVCEKILTLAADDVAHRAYYASVRFCDPRSFHRHSVELVGLSGDEGLAPRFARLSVPKAFVLGAPHGLAARSVELLRENQVEPITLSPAGHWPFVDQPDTFLDELLQFLELSTVSSPS